MNTSAGTLLCFLLFVSVQAPDAWAGGVYFVKEGDTLPRIARIFGVESRSIVELNHLQDVALKRGDRIRIPDRTPKVTPQRPPAPAENSSQQAPTEATARRPAISDRILQAICRDESVYHTVVKGDTLFAISRRYSTELAGLLRLNGLTDRSRLSIGQVILVRRSGPRTHVVAPGETLDRIASRYGVETTGLLRLNQIDGTAIAAGQSILLEACDPLAAAGNTPPPLGKTDAAITAAQPSTAADSPGVPAASAVGGAASFTAAARNLVSFARTLLDIPYRFGGTTLRGIDCSAFVQRVFGFVDVQLPRTAREQYRLGARVDRHELEVGDLVFFRTYASFPSHVGIYVGQNQFIHASSMVRKVTIDSMDRLYYRKHFLGARRLFADAVAVR